MVLDRFIGSRIQHADPRVRISALTRLPAADPLLFESAFGDVDAAVRRAALERLVDLDALDRASRDDADEQNRGVAAARLRSLLAGADTEEPAAAARTAWIESSCAPDLAAFLAEHAASIPVRAAALARVVDEGVLGRVAVHDGTAELRHAALARVHDPAALEEIEHATRGRDQGVSRAARARLQALREAQARHEGAETLCTRMEALAAGTATALDEAAFHHLEQAWSARVPDARDAELAARYERSRDAFRGLLARRAQARHARSPLHESRATLLAELRQATGMNPELARRARETLDETERAWEAVSESDPVDAQRFAALGAEIETHRRRLEEAHTQAQPLRALIDAARVRADAPTPVTRAEIPALEERAQRARRPEDAELARALDHELGEVLERLRQRQRREHDEAASATEQVQAMVSAMEEALARGEVAAALLKHEEAQVHLAQLDAGIRAARGLRQRLQRAAPKLQELRDWQRWGTEQTRTGMCVEVEALVGSAEPLDQLARRIRAYRKEWQQLDRASGTTSKSLWDRFDRACTAAYAPCAAYFSEQRTARTANLERKQALLERLDALDRDTDWNAADLRAAERGYNACEREWRVIGPVDRSLAKELAARHADVRKRLEGRLAPRRESEIARRKAMIAEMTALAESDDFSHAAARVKDAQARWTPAVSARRSVEQALWNDFRAACDAVFARVRAARDNAAVEHRAAAQAAASACERIEALARNVASAAQSDSGALAALVEESRSQLAQLRREYSQAPRPSRGEDAALAARFKAACTKAERAFATGREALARAEVQACAARARFCSELEHRVLGNGDADVASLVDEARQAWDALPPVSGAAGEAVARRFTTVCEAAGSAEERSRLAASLAEQTDEKRRLCLRFEIVAGVPSPPACDAARLSYRAQWMQESMRGTSRWPSTEREKLEEARRIEARWHALGATPVSEDESLEERYRRALDALRLSTGAAS